MDRRYSHTEGGHKENREQIRGKTKINEKH